MSAFTQLMSRRVALRAGVFGGVGQATSGLGFAQATNLQSVESLPLKGRLKHSVARWTFGKLSLDELCRAVKQIGFGAINGIRPNDWPTLRAHSVYCSMCVCAGAFSWKDGFATVSSHDELEARYLKHIGLVADAGYRNLICASGNRRGQGWEEGLTNAEAGLKRILGYAEKRGVVLAMAVGNNREHHDYLCDNTEWGVALCKRLGSRNFGLLYDMYHMQIMEGNIIGTIRRYHEYFLLYLTGGLPGRCEIGVDQELNYPAICRVIAETGFNGYLVQEFFPSAHDPVASLREAIHICDV